MECFLSGQQCYLMCCSKGKFSEEVKRENEIQWNMVTGTFKMAKKKENQHELKVRIK